MFWLVAMVSSWKMDSSHREKVDGAFPKTWALRRAEHPKPSKRYLKTRFFGALGLQIPSKKVLWGVFRGLNTFLEGIWSPRGGENLCFSWFWVLLVHILQEETWRLPAMLRTACEGVDGPENSELGDQKRKVRGSKTPKGMLFGWF